MLLGLFHEIGADRLRRLEGKGNARSHMLQEAY